jgi:hypothetical protein
VTLRSFERAQNFLNDLERGDLARLLDHASYYFTEEDSGFGFTTTALRVYAPAPYDEAIKGLSDTDKARILEAIQSSDADASSISSGSLSVQLDTTRELQPELKLFGEIVAERNMMIDVGTGGARIQSVDDYYKARRKRVHRQLVQAGHDDPNTIASLWDWYHQWPGTYAERRRVVNEMYRPLLDKLSFKKADPVPAREPTGWVRVDRTVDKARIRLSGAAKEEDFQEIGLLCREVLISLAQEVFDGAKHKTQDAVKPSDTDAKRMLEAYFAAELAGVAYEATRKHARAALDLAVALQHKRTADFRFAALCIEATSSVVNIVAIISGRRDKDETADSGDTP